MQNSSDDSNHHSVANTINETLIGGEYYTEEEYLTVQSEFYKIVDEQDPHIALLEAQRRSGIDNRLANVCHQLVHDIGHRAYEKYGDFGIAMQYADVSCNVGYIHGVAETHFDHIDDIKNEVKTICASYLPDKTIGWECRHGIGHGLMWATDNDVNESLKYCDTFDDKNALQACYTGVFMENFNTNELYHPSEFLDSENPFTLCENIGNKYKSDCNHYAIHYYIRANGNDFQKGLARCAETKYFAREDCASGVGDLAIKENINKPKDIEKMCMTAKTTNMQSSCIRGMTGLYTNHYGSVEKGMEMCSTLEMENKGICLKHIQSVPSNFYEKVIN